LTWEGEKGAGLLHAASHQPSREEEEGDVSVAGSYALCQPRSKEGEESGGLRGDAADGGQAACAAAERKNADERKRDVGWVAVDHVVPERVISSLSLGSAVFRLALFWS
jgi:hypothetical protein